jgi:nucleoside 2-deoxyribosyltransferase
MIVYLAGKIKGNKNYKKEFKEAEKKLKEKGHIVLNPAKLPKEMGDYHYMPICLAMIEQADWLVTIDDKDSDGVKIEKKYADYQGIPVMSLDKCLSVPNFGEILNDISNFGKKFNDALDCGCKE